MPRIVEVKAREVLDSRGHPTVEVEILCEDGACGRAIAPAGASRGSAEAQELRDEQAPRYCGRGVRQAVQRTQEVLKPALQGLEVTDQQELDRRLQELDGTPAKRYLGGNTLIATSLAAAHAHALSCHKPLYEVFRLLARQVGCRCIPDRDSDYLLPLPMVNMISGGLHAGRQLEVQDFLIIPCTARSLAEALEMVFAVHRSLGELLRSRGYEANLVADEGGYGPKVRNNEEAIECILQAIEQAGMQAGRDISLALDVAASHFYQRGQYEFKTLNKHLPTEAMIDYVKGWVDRYPIISVEDPLAEHDWTGWELLTQVIGNRVQLIGDDLLATNLCRLRWAVGRGIANSILIKPNQAGTLTETFLVLREAQRAGYRLILSARSGDTEESWLADLAIATGVGQIKIGCITRGERLAKYNQLLRIEDWLGKRGRLAQPFA
ncbi:MAG: phosphopyruvate hydratase [Gemmatales bacterium]|nr:phosphopyruvate hydratase [Gemmatales bacterium]MDW7994143.1 phosphopyruvate hydratase [Gemmatales bacterium]